MLDCETRKVVEGFLKMKVNKKLLQQHLSVTVGKVVTLKDIISNIQTGLVSKEDGNNLDVLVKRYVRYINIIIQILVRVYELNLFRFIS